eukprot:gene6608-35090_t
MPPRGWGYNVNEPTAPTARLRVRRAATLVLLRRAPGAGVQVLRRRDVGVTPAATGAEDPAAHDNRVATLFGAKDEVVFRSGWEDGVVFRSGWEVRMGQREVQNWLRSAPDAPAPMRYPGEWNFPGGA